MNKFTALLLCLLPTLPAVSQAASDISPKSSVTKQADMPFTAAPAANFTGKADFVRYPLMATNKGEIATGLVRFQANARTHWHTHPHGQYLIITEGEGWVQEWGKPAQAVKKGDVVRFAPNVKHWHGAAALMPMSHIAISEAGSTQPSVTWLEAADLPAVSEPKLIKQSSQPLSDAQLSLLPIAAFAATGDLAKLQTALEQGLNKGLSVVRIKEAIAHLYAYIGAPRTLNAMNTFKNLVDTQGIDMPLTTEADNANYYQQGVATLAALSNAPNNAPVQRPIFDFAPALDYSIKAHLYGHLFSRSELLSAVDRELTTIGALSALGGVNAQLRSHFTVAKNLGFQTAHFQQIIITLDETVGKTQAENAQGVLGEMGFSE